MEKKPATEKITAAEVVESLKESPLSRQLTEAELTESVNRITKMMNQND
jgi:hypothetical protein